MRIFFLSLSISLFFQCALSQKKTPDGFNFSKYHERTLSLQKSSVSKNTLAEPVNLQVLDLRADSTSIGFDRQSYFTVPSMCKQIRNSLASQIDLKNEFALKEEQEIIVCIKKLWITSHLKYMDGYWKGGILWKIDCFKKNDGNYSYLCQLDTIIEKSNEKFQQDALDLISICLHASADKIYSALHKFDEPGEFVDFNQINSRSDNVSILDDQHINKGIYRTYDQFLNNSPSDEHFEIEKDKFTDALYTTNSAGAFELEKKVWGYCDGEKMYVKSGQKYFQLYRVNNAFYIYGSKNIDKNVEFDVLRTNLIKVATDSGPKITYYTISYFPLQLDISNGNIY